MKNILLLLLAILIYSAPTHAQSSSESMDEAIEEMQKGLDELQSYLKSDDFKKQLENAKEEVRSWDWDCDLEGEIIINGESLDLEDTMHPMRDILDHIEKHGDISGDLEDILDENGSMLESFMRSMEDSFDALYRYFREEAERDNSGLKTL